MSPKVVAIKTEPPDALQTRRAELMAEATKLSKVREARSALERRLAELDAEQGQIDEAERASWREWAVKAEGSPPVAQAGARESIAQRRALIARDLAGALAGERAIEPRLHALNAELRDLGLKIFEQCVAGLVDEAAAINAEVHAAAAAYLAVCQRADGLRDAVIEQLDQTVNGADRERESVLRSAFSRLEGLEAPRLVGDAGERARHASDYRRRLA